MSNTTTVDRIAGDVVKRLFGRGVNRLQQMKGTWPYNEKPCGGFCKKAVHGIVASALNGYEIRPPAKKRSKPCKKK